MLIRIPWLTKLFKKHYLLYIIISIAIIYILLSHVQRNDNDHNHTEPKNIKTTTRATYAYFDTAKKPKTNEIISHDVEKNSEIRARLMKDRIKRLERRFNKTRSIITNSKPMLKPNYNVHIFYYAWYANPQYDKQYKHWNHKYLENWHKDDSKIYPAGQHEPPEDIGSNYYPSLGCYSSNDPKTIDTHLKQISDAGIGVVVLSWAPPNFTDNPTEMLPKLFDIAFKYNLKIALHVEPYAGRNPINLIQHLRSFFQQYGHHPALYKIKKPLGSKLVPVIYIYDSYLIPDAAWKELFSSKGNLSVRNTDLDAIYLGLLVEMKHKAHIKKSQFDGFYTYFATNSFTYGSTWKNWKILSKFAVQNGLIFVPSVGPGYVDTKVRPWNEANTRPRRHGHYYDVAWQSAINNHANYVSITSFNEWHEGTQIEPARSQFGGSKFAYMDYEPEGPNYYLNLTRSWIEQFEKSMG